MTLRLVFVLFSVLVLSGCAKNPATGSLDFALMTKNKEYEQGRLFRLANISNSKIYKSEDLQSYVSNLANKVYYAGERPEEELVTYLLDDDVANAMAVPGYVFINRGLLPFLQDEAALIAILGHEVGHINARHMVKDHGRVFLIEWLLNSISPNLSRISKDEVTKNAMLFNSRKDERQADLLAIRYLKKLNIPAENVMLYHKTNAIKEKITLKLANLNVENKRAIVAMPAYKSTHPTPDARTKAIAEATNEWLEFLKPYKQKEFYDKINGLEYGYAGKNNLSPIAIKDFKSGKSSIYGYKNLLYLKKAKLKIILPKDYQARVMSYDPVGYNYLNDIVVGFKEISDDKNIYSLDIMAEMLGLTKKEKKKLANSLKTDVKHQGIYYLKNEPNFLQRLFGVKGDYYYFYIQQIENNANKVNYLNHFRITYLYTTSKKSFDERMLNDILFIKQNMLELTSEQASKIKPLSIKITKLKHNRNIKDLAEENMPYIYYSEDWFRAMNALFNDMQTDVGSDKLYKLIPNPNKDI